MTQYVSRHAYRPLDTPWRSEEHTSELQSQSNLVCRLLLEKKKKRTYHNYIDNNLKVDTIFKTCPYPNRIINVTLSFPHRIAFALYHIIAPLTIHVILSSSV